MKCTHSRMHAATSSIECTLSCASKHARKCGPLPDARGALANCRHDSAHTHGGNYAPPRRRARAAAAAARPAASARTCAPAGSAAVRAFGTVRRWASDAKAHGAQPTNKQTNKRAAAPCRTAARGARQCEGPRAAAMQQAKSSGLQQCNMARCNGAPRTRDARNELGAAPSRTGAAARRGAQRCDFFVGRVEQKVDDVVPKATQFGADVGRGGPSPGADVSRGGPSPGADVGRACVRACVCVYVRTCVSHQTQAGISVKTDRKCSPAPHLHRDWARPTGGVAGTDATGRAETGAWQRRRESARTPPGRSALQSPPGPPQPADPPCDVPRPRTARTRRRRRRSRRQETTARSRRSRPAEVARLRLCRQTPPA